MNAIDATEYRKKLDYELSYDGHSEDVKVYVYLKGEDNDRNSL